MACATLVPSRSSKRRHDMDDGELERQGSPSSCKRRLNDFGLSPASFGSVSASRVTGRFSPNSRDAGRSPSHISSSNRSPSRISPESSVAKLTDLFAQSTSASPDPEERFTLDEAFELFRQELINQDNQLKQEYDQALQEKSAEQYQVFLQFAQVDLQTNMQGSPADAEMSYIG